MIRRVLSLCFVLALSVIVMADARAHSPYPCDDRQDDCSISVAYAQASNIANATAHCNTVSQGLTASISTARGSGDWWTMTMTCKTSNGTTIVSGSQEQYYFTAGCPGDQVWNPSTNQCDASCSSKPAMQNVRFQVTGGSAGSACSGGCEYAVDLSSGTGQTGLFTIGGQQFYRAASMSPTGASCTVGNQPAANDSQACTLQGNLTQCLKEDGRHCATASTGKEFCWQPGENGIKASGNDAATKSPSNTEVKKPPLAPNNGGEWTQTGQSTVTTTINNVTNTSTVTGWQSSYGGQGQGSTGGGATGEGNSGSGSGSGTGGNGNGNGNGDDEGDDDGPGGPGAGLDDLYTPTDKTVGSVFAAFKTRVSDAPIVDAIDGFFTVNASGGCPAFTLPASGYWDAMTFDAHCSGDFLSSLQAIGWVLMALAAFLAAIWALS